MHHVVYRVWGTKQLWRQLRVPAVLEESTNLKLGGLRYMLATVQQLFLVHVIPRSHSSPWTALHFGKPSALGYTATRCDGRSLQIGTCQWFLHGSLSLGCVSCTYQLRFARSLWPYDTCNLQATLTENQRAWPTPEGSCTATSHCTCTLLPSSQRNCSAMVVTLDTYAASARRVTVAGYQHKRCFPVHWYSALAGVRNKTTPD